MRLGSETVRGVRSNDLAEGGQGGGVFYRTTALLLYGKRREEHEKTSCVEMLFVEKGRWGGEER